MWTTGTRFRRSTCRPRRGAAAVVALGDSITDGHGATTNGNDRWTDVLAERLAGVRRKTRNIGVSNQGIGGNHLLTDGLGPNVLARFDRDVLAPAGVRWVIVFEGVNDLGGLARERRSVRRPNMRLWCSGYSLRISRSLPAPMRTGLRVYGATITPYVGSDYYHPGPLSEADRQAVNQWIRAAGHFDAVIDFDSRCARPRASRPAAARLRLRRPPCIPLRRRLQGDGQMQFRWTLFAR